MDVQTDLKTLLGLVSRFGELTFLQGRISKLAPESLSHADLVGLYRLAAGILADEFEKNRQKTHKMEAELTQVRRHQDALKRESIAPYERRIREAEEAIREKDARLAKAAEEQQKLLSDFSAYRNRLQEEKKKAVETANEQFLVKMLEVADNFERAVAACKTTDNLERVVEGVDMIQRLFQDILKAEGVCPMACKGDPFDPVRHEAFDQEISLDYPEDTVLEEMRKGYFLREKVLRPALVKVSKLPPEGSPECDRRAERILDEIHRELDELSELADFPEGNEEKGLAPL